MCYKFVLICHVDFVKFLSYWTLTANKPTHKTSNYVLSQMSSSALISNNIPRMLTTHHQKVFTYFQWYTTLNHISYTTGSSFHHFHKLIKLNTKAGLKQQTRHTINNSLYYIYSLFNDFNQDIAVEYANYKIFFEFSKTFPTNFYKPDFFIKYICLYLELIFLIKRTYPKKKSKKIKITPKLRILYIPSHRRTIITLRLINTYINNFNLRTKSIRFSNAILYLALAGKNSFLYKKKIATYLKLLEKKKFY